MKRIISCLIATIVLFSLVSCFAESEWYKSDDGVLEVRFVSFEEKSFPQYDLNLQFRLDGSKESEIITYTNSLSSAISGYTSKHPEMKNRKVSVLCDGQISSFSNVTGTSYVLSIPLTIGDSEIVTVEYALDAVTVFPNDFVNSEAMIAAMFLQETKNVMIDPSSFAVTHAEISRKGDTLFFGFNVTAKNRMGGLTNELVYAVYEEASGKYALQISGKTILDTGVDYDSFRVAIMNYILNDYHFESGTELSLDIIQNYME